MLQESEAAMDFDSSSKFISSLAKFLQSLCNGYVEFDSDVEVIGHIYLNVDTGKKIDYILNEKVCKTDENAVTFISNSFHAQPAEKPKSNPKVPKLPDQEKSVEVSSRVDDDDILILDEPESKNIGTVPQREISLHLSASPHSRIRPSSATKRPYSQSFSQSHKPLSKHSRNDPSSVQSPNGAHPDIDSLHSERSNSSSNFFNPQLPSDPTITAASESDMSHLSQVLSNTFGESSNNQSSVDGRVIKQETDSDISMLNVKQEYEDASGQGDDEREYEDSQDQSGLYPGSYEDQYYGGRRGQSQRSDYSHMGGDGQGEFFQGVAGASSEGGTGDSTAAQLSQVLVSGHWSARTTTTMNSLGYHHQGPGGVLTSNYATPKREKRRQLQQSSFLSQPSKEKRKNFECEICGKRLPSRREYVGHMNGRHLGQKPFACELCGRQFAYITSLPMHKKACPGLVGTRRPLTTRLKSSATSTSVVIKNLQQEQEPDP